LEASRQATSQVSWEPVIKPYTTTSKLAGFQKSSKKLLFTSELQAIHQVINFYYYLQSIWKPNSSGTAIAGGIFHAHKLEN
jgi:hypothetical protein